MSQEQPHNPLHGVTLKQILEDLVARHGWSKLGARIPIRCFTHEPGLESSLKFLRKTEWARARVERLYLNDQRKLRRKESPSGAGDGTAASQKSFSTPARRSRG
jgi:uncharacterized protein (DUF2132 family)